MARFQRHDFPGPPSDLARYVDKFWIVSWDYESPYRQLVVPYPQVHLTFRSGTAEVHGVASGHVYKELAGP
ncbi:MAG TPA: DUF6597 domain-containing transcriptional factor [Pseudonocardiaceae bacterium]|nr:DUF6597 domain-containing transcriptional factor [Pseudonocardiaceae bacterium]